MNFSYSFAMQNHSANLLKTSSGININTKTALVLHGRAVPLCGHALLSIHSFMSTFIRNSYILSPTLTIRVSSMLDYLVFRSQPPSPYSFKSPCATAVPCAVGGPYHPPGHLLNSYFERQWKPAVFF